MFFLAETANYREVKFTVMFLLSFCIYYPHMPIDNVWTYRLLFVCVFVCLYGYGFLLS